MSSNTPNKNFNFNSSNIIMPSIKSVSLFGLFVGHLDPILGSSSHINFSLGTGSSFNGMKGDSSPRLSTSTAVTGHDDDHHHLSESNATDSDSSGEYAYDHENSKRFKQNVTTAEVMRKNRQWQNQSSTPNVLVKFLSEYCLQVYSLNNKFDTLNLSKEVHSQTLTDGDVQNAILIKQYFKDIHEKFCPSKDKFDTRVSHNDWERKEEYIIKALDYIDTHSDSTNASGLIELTRSNRDLTMENQKLKREKENLNNQIKKKEIERQKYFDLAGNLKLEYEKMLQNQNQIKDKVVEVETKLELQIAENRELQEKKNALELTNTYYKRELKGFRQMQTEYKNAQTEYKNSVVSFTKSLQKKQNEYNNLEKQKNLEIQDVISKLNKTEALNVELSKESQSYSDHSKNLEIEIKDLHSKLTEISKHSIGIEQTNYDLKRQLRKCEDTQVDLEGSNKRMKLGISHSMSKRQEEEKKIRSLISRTDKVITEQSKLKGYETSIKNCQG